MQGSVSSFVVAKRYTTNGHVIEQCWRCRTQRFRSHVLPNISGVVELWGWQIVAVLLVHVCNVFKEVKTRTLLSAHVNMLSFCEQKKKKKRAPINHGGH